MVITDRCPGRLSLAMNDGRLLCCLSLRREQSAQPSGPPQDRLFINALLPARNQTGPVLADISKNPAGHTWPHHHRTRRRPGTLPESPPVPIHPLLQSRRPSLPAPQPSATASPAQAAAARTCNRIRCRPYRHRQTRCCPNPCCASSSVIYPCPAMAPAWHLCAGVPPLACQSAPHQNRCRPLAGQHPSPHSQLSAGGRLQQPDSPLAEKLQQPDAASA